MAETTTKEDIRIDADEADELNREAADDLESIERAVKQEAEEYVEAVDGDGNEKESVEAAATAFDFDEAEGATTRGSRHLCARTVAAPFSPGSRRRASHP